MKVQFVVILRPGEPDSQVSTVTFEVPETVPSEVTATLAEVAGKVVELKQIINQ